MKQQIISEAYSQAIEASTTLDVHRRPRGEVTTKTLELPESGPFTFTVDVEITPRR